MLIRYTGTNENKYEFVIIDETHIDYVKANDVVIEDTKVQTPVLMLDVFVLPLFESEIIVDVYLSEEHFDVDSVYIAESSLNEDSSNAGYIRYGLKLFLEN